MKHDHLYLTRIGCLKKPDIPSINVGSIIIIKCESNNRNPLTYYYYISYINQDARLGGKSPTPSGDCV